VIKKTKKAKERGEEEATKEAEENEKGKADNETEATNEDKQDKETTQEIEDDSSCKALSVVNMPSREEKPLIRNDTTAGLQEPRTGAISQELESFRSTKNEEKTSEKEKAKGYQVYLIHIRPENVNFLLPNISVILVLCTKNGNTLSSL